MAKSQYNKGKSKKLSKPTKKKKNAYKRKK